MCIIRFVDCVMVNSKLLFSVFCVMIYMMLIMFFFLVCSFVNELLYDDLVMIELLFIVVCIRIVVLFLIGVCNFYCVLKNLVLLK